MAITIQVIDPEVLTEKQAIGLIGLTLSFYYEITKEGFDYVYPQRIILDKVFTDDDGEVSLQGRGQTPSVRKWIRCNVGHIVSPIHVEIEG